MWWLVWVGIGLLLVVLLAVSCWYDRDARRRGAKPLSGRQMGRERWARDLKMVKPAGVVCDGYRVVFSSVRR